MARGYRLFHAAAVVRDECAVVLAGVPGAGKSTASLHFVEAGWRFLSNDRVLARATADGAIEVRGYPKQPRVNPGTLVHHPRLAGLLEPDDQRALLAMPPADLWALERKCDVDLDALYGAGTMLLASRMAMLVVLRWRPARAEPATFRRLAEHELLDAVPLVAKDLGAFGIGAAAAQRASDAAAYVELHAPRPRARSVWRHGLTSPRARGGGARLERRRPSRSAPSGGFAAAIRSWGESEGGRRGPPLRKVYPRVTLL